MLNLEIKKIDQSFSLQLSNLFSSSSKEYNQHFIPFLFDEKSIHNVLINAKKDYFYGMFFSNQLVGFYMLRGFDEGYEIPSYGVFIKEEFSSKGLGKLSLDHAISLSKLLNKKSIMLKVHPENKKAKTLYEKYGFQQDGIDPKNSNLIMFKDLI